MTNCPKIPHFQLFHRSLENKLLLQLSRGMTTWNLPHLTLPRANIRLVTPLLFLPVITRLPAPKASSGSAQIHGSNGQRCPCLSASCVTLPAWSQETFFVPWYRHAWASTLLRPQHKANYVAQGAKGECSLFYQSCRKHKMSPWPEIMWFDVSFQFIRKRNLKIQNFLQLQVFWCAHLPPLPL